MSSLTPLVLDAGKPDGTMRKLQDVSRMTELGWRAKVGLREGVERTYKCFWSIRGISGSKCLRGLASQVPVRPLETQLVYSQWAIKDIQKVRRHS